MVNKVNFSGF